MTKAKSSDLKVNDKAFFKGMEASVSYLVGREITVSIMRKLIKKMVADAEKKGYEQGKKEASQEKAVVLMERDNLIRKQTLEEVREDTIKLIEEVREESIRKGNVGGENACKYILYHFKLGLKQKLKELSKE